MYAPTPLNELHGNRFDFHIYPPRVQGKLKKSFVQLGLFLANFNRYLKLIMLDLKATARAWRKIRNSNQNNFVNFLELHPKYKGYENSCYTKLIFKILEFSVFFLFKLHTNRKSVDNNAGNEPEILRAADIS